MMVVAGKGFESIVTSCGLSIATAVLPKVGLIAAGSDGAYRVMRHMHTRHVDEQHLMTNFSRN